MHLLGQFMKVWMYQSLIDIMMNVFHVAENRYILQNQIEEFKGIFLIIEFIETDPN